MSAPDPEGISLLGKALIALGAVGAPIAWAYKVLNGKADKGEVAEQFQKVEDELTRHRDVQAKIFDQIRDSDQRAQDRHERLMERLRQRGEP